MLRCSRSPALHRVSSFKQKLARLSTPASTVTLTPASTSSSEVSRRQAPVRSFSAPSPRPSLDELRDRIARIVGRTLEPPRRADPSSGELPFLVEHTDEGPLYVLHGATSADPAMLALLALDPRLAGCSARSALYLDTETTGLAGGTGTVAFLVGLAWLDAESGAWMLEQLLLRRLGEEAPILAVVARRVRCASMIVTYNGKTFDWPLLRTRFVMNRMACPEAPPHLDLLHVARRVHARRLPVRTLAAIEENVLGRGRVGDVSGGEIVSRYAHFLRTGDEDALVGVVEHNAADVLSMVALTGLYGEPVGSLIGEDLAGVARTVRRAGALERAAELAEEAVQRGGGHDARRARGDIAKARGDKARALADYESIAAEIDDASVRLELAKLYEHHVREPGRALSAAELGTGESDQAWLRRLARLRRKAAR